MALRADFIFHQGNLQDYVDCKRRFQLRAVYGVIWPTLLTEPAKDHEIQLQQGAQFHRMIHQHLIGIPIEKLSNAAREKPLITWWQDYLDKAPADIEGDKYPEIQLTVGIHGYHLAARYDLIVIGKDDSVRIFDWKTSQRPASREQLRQRMQSIVYPFLLVKAGAHLNRSVDISPDQIQMVYWFVGHGGKYESIAYSQNDFRTHEKTLSSMIEEILNSQEGDFPKTLNEKYCLFCRYKSLCERGLNAGGFIEDEPDIESNRNEFDFDIDFDAIEELTY